MKPLSSYHGDRGVERADGQRRHGARKPDAAAAGAQGRVLPVSRAGRLGEGAVPVAVRFADDLRLKLSPDAFAAYRSEALGARLEAHAAAAKGPALTHLLLYDRSTFPSLADRRRHHGG